MDELARLCDQSGQLSYADLTRWTGLAALDKAVVSAMGRLRSLFQQLPPDQHPQPQYPQFGQSGFPGGTQSLNQSFGAGGFGGQSFGAGGYGGQPQSGYGQQ